MERGEEPLGVGDFLVVIIVRGNNGVRYVGVELEAVRKESSKI